MVSSKTGYLYLGYQSLSPIYFASFLHDLPKITAYNVGLAHTTVSLPNLLKSLLQLSPYCRRCLMCTVQGLFLPYLTGLFSPFSASVMCHYARHIVPSIKCFYQMTLGVEALFCTTLSFVHECVFSLLFQPLVSFVFTSDLNKGT